MFVNLFGICAIIAGLATMYYVGGSLEVLLNLEGVE